MSMIWNIVVGRQILLWAAVDDEFLYWLQQNTRGSFIGDDIDPYCDTVLDMGMQNRCLEGLRLVADDLRKQILIRIQAEKRLPQDPLVRTQIQEALVERELQKHPHAQKTAELIAFLELALESGALIAALGD